MNIAERNTLVVNNLPLVGYLVSDLCGRANHLHREDLASVGAIALITSATNYDPSRGVPFGAFARRRIIGALADELRNQDWAPRSARKRVKEYKKVEETLSAALGRVPKVSEIAEAMGVDVATAQMASDDAARSVEAFEEGTYTGLVHDGPTPEDEVLTIERAQLVREAVATLPERMRVVVEEIYFRGRSVGDVAKELGLTHSAVSHARIEAMRLLRDGLEAHYSDNEPSSERDVVVHSKISESRRRDYLDALGTRTAGGITRAAAAYRALPEPAEKAS